MFFFKKWWYQVTPEDFFEKSRDAKRVTIYYVTVSKTRAVTGTTFLTDTVYRLEVIARRGLFKPSVRYRREAPNKETLQTIGDKMFNELRIVAPGIPIETKDISRGL